jgi:hypothetical protein
MRAAPQVLHLPLSAAVLAPGAGTARLVEAAMSEIDRCIREQATCAERIDDPAKLAAWCAKHGGTPEGARVGALAGLNDYVAEEVLLRLEMESE